MDQTHSCERPRGSGTVRVRVTDAGARLLLTGEIDVSMNAELYAAVSELEDLGMPIEVHTSEVTFIDSSVMAFLASLVRRCDQPIRLVDPPALVRYLLRVAELEDVVEIVDRHPGPGSSSVEVDGTAFRARDACSCSACRTVPALIRA